VRGTFEASTKAAGQSILVIDDICTTAETLFACARALKAKKARRVCALTVARA
jgi:predicted amidophosphoribosyltransferase